MTRGQKKFLYGLFYVIVLGLIIWAFIPSPIVPVPVCSGPSCGTNQPLSLQVSGVPQMFKSEGTHRVVALGQVTNPNPDFGASVFSYDFLIFDRDGKTIASVPGSEIIYPSETNYILGIYDAGKTDLSSIAERPGFEIKSANFRPAAEFLKPEFSPVSGYETKIASDGIRVSGKVKNLSSFPIGEAKVIGILGDKYGDPLFAAQTTVSGITGLGEADFEIYFPAEKAILDRLDMGKTSVFFYAI
ncbi:MAG: hypothetical protein AAB399_00940 [Patescibacteria group bacterium]